MNYLIGFFLTFIGVVGMMGAMGDLGKYGGIHQEARSERVIKGGAMWFYLGFLACLVAGGVGLLVPGGIIGP